MTSIFSKVKPGDLITSDLFNQITDQIEKMHEITSFMEIKKDSEADASELGNLSIKSNLGIGTKESPSEKLEVNGTVKTGNDGQLLLLKGLKSSKKGEESSMNLDFMTSSQGRTPPSTPTASFRAIDDEYFSSHFGFFTQEKGQDQNNLTERLRITSDGNVGIGTPTPSEKLEVIGVVKADKFLGDGSGLKGIKTGQWTDIPGGISYNSGNIGIGSDTPENADGWSKVLDILGSGTTKLSIRTPKIDARVLSHEDGFWGAPAGMIVGTKSAHSLSFGTSATSRMTINKDGNVGIGTPTPSAKLEVNGNIKAKAIEAKPALHDFKVEGDLDKFYPVLFRDDNWAEGSLILEINRPDVHTDSEARGSLISKFTVHSPKLGNGADMCRAEIYDSGTQFIAGYQNDILSNKFVVWLRGGGTTYYFRSSHFPTLEDFSATEKKYKVNEKEVTFSIKTSVDSNVLSNTIHLDKSLIIDGNVGIGMSPQKEKLEVKGTVKADKFVGDGSGLKGIKTGQWTDIPGGISYNSGNIGIGSDSPENADGWSKVLDILGSGTTKLSIRTQNIDSRVLSHESGFWGAPPGMIIGTGSENSLSFGTNATSKMTIDKDGNVGIGTMNPNAKLDVNGDIRVNNNNLWLREAGDNNHGIGYSESVDGPMVFGYSGGALGTAGDEQKIALNWNSAGNVGIGTMNPVNKLDVFGDAYFGTDVENEHHKVVIRGPNQPGGFDSFQDLSYEFAGAGSAKIRAYRGGSWDTYLQFLTNPDSDTGDDPQVRMQINGDGNVGIGAMNPNAKLDVNGDIRVNNNNIWLRGAGDNNHGIGYSESVDGPMVFGYSGGALGTAGDEQKIALNWNSAGNVGIGTADIKRQLHVEGSNSEIHSGGSGAGFSFANRNTEIFVDSPSEGERWVWYSAGDPGVAHLWSGNNLLSIDKDGNIGIGTTTTELGNDPHMLLGGNIHIENNKTFYSHGRMHIYGEEILYLLNKNGVRVGKGWGGSGDFTVEGSILCEGNIIYSGSIRQSSRTLKEDIHDLSTKEAFEVLESLNPVKFVMKKDEMKRLQVGFIAEDAPDLTVAADRKGIINDNIVAILTKVIKEQQKTIKALIDDVNTLKINSGGVIS